MAATVISELGAVCRNVPGYRVQVQAADMLVTVSFPNGRKQTVKVWSCQNEGDPAPVVRLLSRAGIVVKPAIVRDALRQNKRHSRAGFAMDTTVQPPALDVICGLVVDPQNLPVNDFLDALHAVATLADHVEARMAGGADEF